MKITRIEPYLFRTFGITPEMRACLNCKHFKQHYIADRLTGGVYATPIPHGHCMYPRFKNRRVDDVCGNFEGETGAAQ